MNRLKELRKEKKLTIAKAAEENGIKYTTYRSYETGDRQMNDKTLRLLSTYYGVSIDYLVGRSENREKDLTPPGVEDDDNLALREMLRTRPDVKILFDASKDAPTSAILEAAALIMKYKEASGNK